MNENKQVELLKKKCYELYELKDNPSAYDKAVIKLEQRVSGLNLGHFVNPLELGFFLRFFSSPFPETKKKFPHVLVIRRNIVDV